jgi:hypothetical protein
MRVENPALLAASSALFVAHPGHEMRLHGWLARARPVVCVLTDGSGRSGLSRLNSTTNYLQEIGAERGSLYGRFSDQEIYCSLLRHDYSLFIELVNELAETFKSARVELVVGDAAEGYNSTHDLCRLLVNAAVRIASGAGRGRISNYDFPVVNRPDSCPEDVRAAAIWLHLDDATFALKMAAARKHYPELVNEMETALSGNGDSPLLSYLERQESHQAEAAATCLDNFRVEVLRPVGNRERFDALMRHKPFYELHGERQVAAGHYAQTIRYREHLAPLADALQQHVERNV